MSDHCENCGAELFTDGPNGCCEAEREGGAIERELRVMKNFASCGGDLDAIEEALQEAAALRARLKGCEAALRYETGGGNCDYFRASPKKEKGKTSDETL